MRHVKCVYSAVGVQCSAVPCLVAPAAHLCANPSKSTLEIVQVDAGLSALCLGLEGLDLAGFGACAPCLYVSAGCHEPFKGPLLRGNSVLRSVHTRCSCLMQPVRSGRRRCALAQCGRAPGPGWARKRGIRESPRTEARAHAKRRPWALAAPCVLTCADRTQNRASDFGGKFAAAICKRAWSAECARGKGEGAGVWRLRDQKESYFGICHCRPKLRNTDQVFIISSRMQGADWQRRREARGVRRDRRG